MTINPYEMMKRAARLLWHMGYLVRTQVPLSSYLMDDYSISREDITDIDTLGLKWGIDNKPSSVVCECKTGSKAKPIDRTLWLSGVKSYFNAEMAYLFCEKGHSAANAVGTDLDINVFDLPLLERVEKSYSIVPDDWFASISDEYFFTREKIFTNRDLPAAEGLRYVRYGYWIQPPYLQLKRTIWVGQRIAKVDKRVDELDWLVLELFVLFASSLVSFSSEIFSGRLQDLKSNISAELFGGHLSLSERKQIVDSLYNFINSYLKKHNDRLPFPKMRTLEPDYFEELIEIIDRILKTNEYVHVPRFADYVIFEWIVDNNPIDKSEISSRFSNLDINLLIKLTKNLVTFFLKSTGISSQQFQPIYDY